MITDPVSQRLPLKVIEHSGTPIVYTEEDRNRLRQKLDLFDSESEFKSTGIIPPFWYHDLEIYEAERRTVLGKNWVAIGSTNQIPAARSYLTENVADEPVVVLRNKDGTLKSFLNLCSHRATQLLTKPEGRLEDDEIQCDYHRWRYEASTGKLIHPPELGKVKGVFSIEELGLRPFEVDTWGPLVFVRMEPGADSLSTVLAPLIEQTAGMDLSSLEWKHREVYEVQCNWKSYIDNFLDGGYHVPSIHPELAQSLSYKEYRTDLFKHGSLQHSPTQVTGGANVLTRSGQAKYWWFFPNTMINIYDGVMDTNLVLPLGPNKCKVIFDFFFSKEWEQPSIDGYIRDAHKTQLQDMSVCERQRLQSRFYRSGPYGNREVGQHQFHQLLARNLQTAVG